MPGAVVGGPGIQSGQLGKQATIGRFDEPNIAPVFPAVITASALIGGYEARWRYTWTRVIFDDADGGKTNRTEAGVAINLVELAHIAEPAAGTAWYVWGINCHDTSAATTLSPRPIGGGGTTGTHKVDMIVDLTKRFASDGTILYTFSQVGSVEPTC